MTRRLSTGLLIAAGIVVIAALLLLRAPGNPAMTAAQSATAGSGTPDPTSAAQARLRDFMNDIDPAITVKVGDLIPDVTLPLAMPDGATRTVALRDVTRGQRTVLYYYVQDNTPL